MKYRSIKSKLIRAVAALLVSSSFLILVVVSLLNTKDARSNLVSSERNIRDSLVAKGLLIARNNSEALKGMVEDNAFTAVEALVTNTVNSDKDIAYGLFVDIEGRVWVFSTSGKEFDSSFKSEMLEGEIGVWARELSDAGYRTFGGLKGETYEFASPIIVEEEKLGFIRYGLSTRSMRESLSEAAEISKKSLERTLLILASAILGTLIIGIFVIRRIAHTLSSPLTLLENGASTIASGNYDNEININTDDEIGILATQFELMRSTIKKKIADLAKLNATGELLASSFEQPNALEIVLIALRDQINVSEGSIYLLGEADSFEIRSYFPVNQNNKTVARCFKYGEGIVGLVAESKDIIYVEDTRFDKNFHRILDSSSGKALLCVPLVDNEKVVGVMNLSGEPGEVRFQDSDREFISSLARSLVITIKNIQMRDEIEEYSKTLEHRVKERTRELAIKTSDISNMLMNMHQGLFTINENKKIHPEYSAYLETILETSTIAGVDFIELLFSNSEIGSNEIDQVVTAIDSVIGEDSLMFSFNSHLLSDSLKWKGTGNKEKILELDWDPIVKDEIIQKLMVTVRDVTELNKLKGESEAQKKELEIIGQLISVGEKKATDFLKGSFRFLAECEDIIKRTNEKEMPVIDQLFRNMHTIKGNARTFGFNFVTDSVHEVESTYDLLRKDKDMSWSQDELLAELSQVRKDLKYYESVSIEKLGYGGIRSKANLGEEIAGIILDNTDLLSHEDLSESGRDALRRIEYVCLQDICGTLSEVLADVCDSVSNLALELGKSSPRIVIEEDSVFISKDFHSVIVNVFMHLFRNAIDHGIEYDEERLKGGKTVPGNIIVACEKVADGVQLVVKDDGRGLALEKLRRVALDKGLLSQGQALSEELICELVFSSGISTAENVTQVSGRGVGMEAVKKFIEDNGGGISIRTENSEALQHYCRFETIINLPNRFLVSI